jgi:hypothetical protein
MYGSLHHVCAAGAESDGADQERHREKRDVLGLQTQDLMVSLGMGPKS